MNFFKRIFLFLLFIGLCFAGAVLVLPVSGLISTEQWAGIIEVVNSDIHFRVVLFVLGGIIILIGIITPFKLSKSLIKRKTLTFYNPDGEVTISVQAIETYIRKIAKEIPGIKEIKSTVKIGKGGIDVVSYVSITSAVSLPEATENIQMEVKSRIQGILGMDENINMKIHVNRIIKVSNIEVSTPVHEEVREEPELPFME